MTTETHSLLQQAEKALQDAKHAEATSEYPRLGKAAYTELAEALKAQAAVADLPPTPPRGQNNYEERRAARIDRLKMKAAALRVEAARRDCRSHDIGRNIPFGQPILVGHHSERGHRNAIKKMHAASDKAMELRSAAEDAERSIKAAQSNYTISSDDPEAVMRLKEKVAKLEKYRDEIKAVNKLAKKDDAEGLKALGYGDDLIHKFLNPQFSYQGKGIPAYELTNTGAEIRRCKQRIDELSRAATVEAVSAETDLYKLYEDAGENRVCFSFDGKPAENVRSVLKSHGFKWSPTRTAWVRMLNAQGRWAARHAMTQLAKIGQ